MPSNQQEFIRNVEGYDQWSGTYDRMPNATIAADERAFPPFWRHLTGLRVLEIGCGTGRHTRRLVEQGNRVTALDASAGMLGVARADPALGGVNFVEADIFCFQVTPGQEFDAVIASLVLEHVPALPALFAKVRELLRPGGHGFFSEIHPDRMLAGSGARFLDETGYEVRLASFAHTERAFTDAIAGVGLTLLGKDDVTSDAELAGARPEWGKYRGRPMLQIWRLQA